MSDFSELETPIRDTQMVAQILAAMFEDAHQGEEGTGNGIRLTDHEAELFSFLIYDLCKRTKELRQDFYAAFEASMAERKRAAHAA